jgi:D-amino-acid dehydrogenase
MQRAPTPAFDAVVIGAGIVGACSAYALARRGATVAVVDARQGWGPGCSLGNAGLVTPSFAEPIASPANVRAGLAWMVRPDAPFGLRVRPALAGWIARYLLASRPAAFARGAALLRALSLDSLSLALRLDGQGLEVGLEQRGCLVAYSGPAGARHAAAAARAEAALALNARLFTGAATAVEEPLLSNASGAILFPLDAHCDPGKATRAFGRAAVAEGARLQSRTTVQRIDANGSDVRLRTSGGDIVARDLVVAAGAWSGLLARQLGVRLPMQGGKGFALDYDARALRLTRPIYLHDERCVVTPMSDRVRVTGGLLLHGLDERPEPRRIDALRRAVYDAVGLDEAPHWTWTGLRPCTPDGLPVIGRHPRADRVIFATGHGMLGLTLGPLTGELVEGLVAGLPARSELSPQRFG